MYGSAFTLRDSLLWVVDGNRFPLSTFRNLSLAISRLEFAWQLPESSEGGHGVSFKQQTCSEGHGVSTKNLTNAWKVTPQNALDLDG